MACRLSTLESYRRGWPFLHATWRGVPAASGSARWHPSACLAAAALPQQCPKCPGCPAWSSCRSPPLCTGLLSPGRAFSAAGCHSTVQERQELQAAPPAHLHGVMLSSQANSAAQQACTRIVSEQCGRYDSGNGCSKQCHGWDCAFQPSSRPAFSLMCLTAPTSPTCRFAGGRCQNRAAPRSAEAGRLIRGSAAAAV